MKRIILSFVFIYSISLFAQTAENKESDSSKIHLPPVVVTAKGEEENYLEVPTRIDHVSAKSLDRDKVRFVGETLNKIPGVVAREMNPLIPAIGIRTPAKTTSPYWLGTHDSIPVVSSVNYSHESPTRMLFSSGAGDIEVLKGATSVLYGSDAIAAVVNLKSPNPTDTPEHKVGFQGGQRSFYKYRVKSSQWLNEKDGYALAANYTTDTGWRETQSSKRAEANIRYVRKLEGKDTLTTTLIGNGRGTNEAGYLTKAEYDSTPEKSGNTTGLDFFRRNTYGRLATEWKHETESGNTFTITPYLRYDYYNIMEYWSATSLPTSLAISKSLGLRTTYRIPTDSIETILGLEYEYTSFTKRKEQSKATVLGTTPAKDYPQGVQYDYEVIFQSASPFVASSWFFSKDWRLDAGVRGNFSQYDYRNRALDGGCDSANNTDGNCGYFFRANNQVARFNNLSPKSGVNYQINSNSSTYMNAGYGFKIPTAPTLYEITVVEKTPNLKPERSFSYELGYKYDSGFFGADASVYRLDIYDRIVKTQGVANELATSVNAGKSRHEGFELSGRVGPVADLTLNVAANFNKNYYISYSTSGVSYDGKTESFAPKHIFNTRLEYAPSYVKNFQMELEWQKIAGYWVEDANTNWQSGYDLYNFRADYKFGNFETNLKVVNLTNLKYASDVSNSGSLKYRTGMPRTIYAGLDYAF